jgi:4-hydroxythreonine-4-phosphate dehydrogenase
MGDPSGIGAEVTAKALLDNRIYEECKPFVIGNSKIIENSIKTIGRNIPTRIVHSVNDVKGDPDTIEVLETDDIDCSNTVPGQLSEISGKASVQWILKAGELAASGLVQAIVTAPINKEACKLAGYKDVGHMEIFQSQTGVSEVATMLMADDLRVVHLTTHRSLKVACDYVTQDNIVAKLKLTNSSFQEWGFKKPRIGVSALNPHAGDGGLIGDEEKEHIVPAVKTAVGLGMNVTGPIPADSIFNQAIEGIYDVVLAMYHDQGHIPIKVHNWAKSVSVNLGLPFIRTSVDHGTAFDIAGKGLADHKSMMEAIRVAVSLASKKILP